MGSKVKVSYNCHLSSTSVKQLVVAVIKREAQQPLYPVFVVCQLSASGCYINNNEVAACMCAEHSRDWVYLAKIHTQPCSELAELLHSRLEMIMKLQSLNANSYCYCY